MTSPRRLFSNILLLALLLWGPVLAEPHALFENTLTVEVPAVFRSLDQDSIAEMFASSATMPQVVFATPDAETRIAFTYLATPFTPEELEPTRAELTTSMEKAQVVWHKNEIVVLGEKPWFRLDYDLPAKQPPTREILLGTSLRGQLLFLMIATPSDDLELLGPELEGLVESLRETATP